MRNPATLGARKVVRVTFKHDDCRARRAVCGVLNHEARGTNQRNLTNAEEEQKDRDEHNQEFDVDGSAVVDPHPSGSVVSYASHGNHRSKCSLASTTNTPTAMPGP